MVRSFKVESILHAVGVFVADSIDVQAVDGASISENDQGIQFSIFRGEFSHAFCVPWNSFQHLPLHEAAMTISRAYDIGVKQLHG